MNEDFLYYIWQHKLFSPILFSKSKEEIMIISVGERNYNSGPDFLNARIKIGETLWVGNVEIHVKSSDWNLHKHFNNKAYNNVILHVVYEYNIDVKSENGNIIPVLELKNAFPDYIYLNYRNLIEDKNHIPCANLLKTAEIPFLESILETLAIERLQTKSNTINQLLQSTSNSWQECFFQLLAYYFGNGINNQTFQLLKKSLPLTILAKHKDNLFQIEALLFGQAGFLNDDFKDEYPVLLQKEYFYLRKKYNLKPIEKHLWQIFRLRPNNFPTIRISQFAQLLYQSEHLFSCILEEENVKTIANLFLVSTSNYWQTHYKFDAPSLKRNKTTGNSFINNLLINVVVPLLFEYGKQHDSNKFKNKAIQILESLPYEINTVIDKWKSCNFSCSNALQSQALLQLFANYCKTKQCLHCKIGYNVLKTQY